GLTAMVGGRQTVAKAGTLFSTSIAIISQEPSANGPVGSSAPFIPGVTSTSTPTSAPTLTLTVTPCPMSFSDVQPSDYFYEGVRYLYCEGAISGYSDGTFRPYNNVTRAQICKIIVLADHWPINTEGGPHFT